MKSEIWLSWVSCGVCVPVSLRPGSGCPRSGNFLKVGGYSMLPCLASQGFPYVEKIAKLPGRGCYRCWGTNTAKISAKSTYSDWSMNPIHAIFIPPFRQLKSFAIFSYVAVCLPQALLLASLRLRDCRLASAQILHRDRPGIAGLLQFWHLPSSLALCLCSSA